MIFLVDALNDADPSLNLFKGSVDDTINDLDSKNIYETDMFIDNYNYVSIIDPHFVLARTPAVVKRTGLTAEEVQFNRLKEATDKFNRDQAAAEPAGEALEPAEEALIAIGGGLKN